VTACQAFHWFKFDQYYAQVNRILSPNGVIACIAYSPFPYLSSDKMPNRVSLGSLMENIESYKCWVDDGRIEPKILFDGYKDIKLPFNDFIRIDGITSEDELSGSDILGYIDSWSNYQNFKKENEIEGTRFMQELGDGIKSLIGNGSGTHIDLTQIKFHIEWVFFVLMARK